MPVQTFTHRAHSVDHITKIDCSLALTLHCFIGQYEIKGLVFLQEESLRGKVVMHGKRQILPTAPLMSRNAASQAERTSQNDC